MDFAICSNLRKKKEIIQDIIISQEIKKLNKQIKQKSIDINKSSEQNDLKIELFPENLSKGVLKKEPINKKLSKDILGLSLQKEKELAFFRENVPLLQGLYSAHCNHYPVRIKPDDIWLLIVQAFSNHIEENAEKLRHYFVNFD